MKNSAEQTAGATLGDYENDGILFLANTAEARDSERQFMGAARQSDVFDLPDLPHATQPRDGDNMEPGDVFQGGAPGALANHELAKAHKPCAPVPNDGGAVENTTRSHSVPPKKLPTTEPDPSSSSDDSGEEEYEALKVPACTRASSACTGAERTGAAEACDEGGGGEG